MFRSYLRKLARWLRLMLPAPDSAEIELRGGYKILLQPRRDALERTLFAYRTYEPATLALFDIVLRPGDTMVDVGANLGVMTLHAAACVGPTGRIIALEPHPAYFPRLARHVELNGQHQVRVLEIAAGEQPQRLPIFDVPAVNIGRSSLVQPRRGCQVGGTVRVEPLDDILARENCSTVRLIKIDVEGFEFNVLQGAAKTLQRQPIICMEVSARVDTVVHPLAAHDRLMATGLYSAYRFKHGKDGPGCTLRAADRAKLLRQHDNVIYIPNRLLESLPASLFDSRPGVRVAVQPEASERNF